MTRTCQRYSNVQYFTGMSSRSTVVLGSVLVEFKVFCLIMWSGTAPLAMQLCVLFSSLSQTPYFKFIVNKNPSFGKQSENPVFQSSRYSRYSVSVRCSMSFGSFMNNLTFGLRVLSPWFFFTCTFIHWTWREAGFFSLKKNLVPIVLDPQRAKIW